MTRSLFFIVLSAAIAAVACSGPEKPKPKSGTDYEPAPKWSDESSPDDYGEGTGDDMSGDLEDAPPPTPKKKGDERPVDYDISYTDCAALAKTYGRAWRNGELKKLEGKNLKPKQQQAVEATIHKNGQEAQDNWQSECDKTVGSPQVRSRLACALRAKTLDRFNDCLDGKVE